jgi:hypothetical protein
MAGRDLPRESWTTVQVRLNPAHDASGRIDIWLNGAVCGAYQGPMAPPSRRADTRGSFRIARSRCRRCPRQVPISQLRSGWREQAAIEVDQATIRKIAAARTAFLDMDEEERE